MTTSTADILQKATPKGRGRGGEGDKGDKGDKEDRGDKGDKEDKGEQGAFLSNLIAGGKIFLLSYPLPITHYPLPITHYPLPITHYPMPKNARSKPNTFIRCLKS
ncbi:MAG: hypothetical protein KME31_33240 [Tolypothrix carrinoi HA7290-LM1]|jgi:hypothetical protein|nr:hypothetical protein [Tolypothrix carrinoi HA7290-LM1]